MATSDDMDICGRLIFPTKSLGNPEDGVINYLLSLEGTGEGDDDKDATFTASAMPLLSKRLAAGVINTLEDELVSFLSKAVR